MERVPSCPPLLLLLLRHPLFFFCSLFCIFVNLVHGARDRGAAAGGGHAAAGGGGTAEGSAKLKAIVKELEKERAQLSMRAMQAEEELKNFQQFMQTELAKKEQQIAKLKAELKAKG